MPDPEGQEAQHSAAAGGDEGADLLQRIVARDQAAFATLLRLHHGQLYRVAWRVLGGPSDAEDVVQEAFLKLWNSPQSIRDAGAVRAWLVRVAFNLAIDRIRRKTPVPVAELPEVADDALDPEEAVRSDQLAAEMDAAIAGLPERQRLALILTYYEGLGNKETAAALEISVDAVESLLARARRSLKIALAENWRGMLNELEALRT